MKKIVFINVYFGKFPVWFPAFLKSCETLNEVTFLFFTNCAMPAWYPQNVKFIKFTSSDLVNLCREKTGHKLNFEKPYKMCDIKPMYGHWFSEFIKDFEYWGHCDIDLIWGDIRRHLDEEISQGFDVIKGQPDRVSGHCAIFRNDKAINKLYQQSNDYPKILAEAEYCSFDEISMDQLLKEQTEFSISGHRLPYNFFGREKPYGNAEGSIFPTIQKFEWNQGILTESFFLGKTSESAYLHFRNWKDKQSYCDPEISQSNKFYLSFFAMHTDQKNLVYKMRMYAYLLIKIGLKRIKKILGK